MIDVSDVTVTFTHVTTEQTVIVQRKLRVAVESNLVHNTCYQNHIKVLRLWDKATDSPNNVGRREYIITKGEVCKS